MTTSSLYDEVVSVTYAYLGPAADRFVIRQIRNHLHKDPEQLERTDLRQLVDWIQLAMRLISDDREIIDRYVAELQGLVQPKRSTQSNGKGSK